MNRPTVIVEGFSSEQQSLLYEAVKVWKTITNYPTNVKIARDLIRIHGQGMSGLALFTMLSNAKAKLLVQ